MPTCPTDVRFRGKRHAVRRTIARTPKYTPDLRSSRACFNIERLSQHFRPVPRHTVGRNVAAGRPRGLGALLSGDDEILRLVPVERGKAVGRDGSAAGALHREKLLVAGLQADGPDIGDQRLRTRCDGMLAD